MINCVGFESNFPSSLAEKINTWFNAPTMKNAEIINVVMTTIVYDGGMSDRALVFYKRSEK